MRAKVYNFFIRLSLLIAAVQFASGFLPQAALAAAEITRSSTTSVRTNERLSIKISNSSNDPVSSSSPIPPPPSVSMPVYSLASTSEDNRPSMNIVTFTTPVSIKPRLCMVSLYHHTMTKDSFLHSKYGILQLLNKDQKCLVPILGKSSGYDTTDLGDDMLNPKEGECQDKGYTWINENDSFGQNLKDDEARNAFREIKVLPQCSSYIGLKLMNTMDAGDHVMALCEVVAVGKWDNEQECVIDVDIDSGNSGIDQEQILYSGLLREKGII